MSGRNIFGKVDFVSGTVEINGITYELLDKNFPTVDPKTPLALSKGEEELMAVLANSFMHSKRLNEHINFLLSKGSMYSVCNGNLLFHGCIPMDENGKFQSVSIDGEAYSGKALLDKIDETVSKAY